MAKFYQIQVKKLQELEAAGKVYFDELCNFEPTQSILVFDELTGTSLRIFKQILLGLEDWINLFFERKGVVLDVSEKGLPGDCLGLYIKWEREHDYAYFVKLTNYYLLSIGVYVTPDFQPLLKRILKDVSNNEDLATNYTNNAKFKEYLTLILERVAFSIRWEITLGIEGSVGQRFLSSRVEEDNIFKSVLALLEEKQIDLIDKINIDSKTGERHEYALYHEVATKGSIINILIGNMSKTTNIVRDSTGVQIINALHSTLGDISLKYELASKFEQEKFAKELDILLEYLNKSDNSGAETKFVISTLEIAAQEAKQNKFDSAINFLLKVGREILGITKDIGVNIVSDIISKNLGI